MMSSLLIIVNRFREEVNCVVLTEFGVSGSTSDAFGCFFTFLTKFLLLLILFVCSLLSVHFSKELRRLTRLCFLEKPLCL